MSFVSNPIADDNSSDQQSGTAPDINKENSEFEFNLAAIMSAAENNVAPQGQTSEQTMNQQVGDLQENLNLGADQDYQF
jgi:hypothetical protein